MCFSYLFERSIPVKIVCTGFSSQAVAGGMCAFTENRHFLLLIFS